MIVITTPTGQIGGQLVPRLLDMSQQIGGALGVAILATIADSHTQTLLHTGSHPPVGLTQGYDRALLISAGFVLAAAALTAVLISPPAQPQPLSGRAQRHDRPGRELTHHQPGEPHGYQRPQHHPHCASARIMKQGDDAFNTRDFAAMDAIHHPDMIAHVTSSAEPIHGRVAHAEAMKQMFAMFPDVHVNNDPYPIQIGQGDWTTVITRATGTFTGEMTLPDGNVIPPTGKAFDLDFATTARWEADTMIEEHVFWDSALQAQQIGLA